VIFLLAEDDAHQVTGGLSGAAHAFLFIGTVVSVAFILFLLRRRQLRGKYAMVWTIAAFALAILAIFPGVLAWVSEQLGITYPPALFAVVAIGFLLVVVIQFSWELTRQEDHTRKLAEEIGLLRSELDDVKRDRQSIDSNTTIMPSDE
jgi:hypothetical protein